MSISSADEVRASVALQHHATRDSMVALIVLQYRPQATFTAKYVKTFAASLMENFKASGWEDPVLLFRGGHLASSAQVDVTGALDPRTDVTITGPTSADVLYTGPIPRDEVWCALAAKAGSVGVLVGVHHSMDDPAVLNRLGRLAEGGKLLAAVGQLTDNVKR